MMMDELENFVAENTAAVVARNWQDDIARAEAAEAEVELWRLEVSDIVMVADFLNAELKAEVVRLRAALAEALDPNTEWTLTTWARLLAVRDGETLVEE